MWRNFSIWAKAPRRHRDRDRIWNFEGRFPRRKELSNANGGNNWSVIDFMQGLEMGFYGKRPWATRIAMSYKIQRWTSQILRKPALIIVFQVHLKIFIPTFEIELEARDADLRSYYPFPAFPPSPFREMFFRALSTFTFISDELEEILSKVFKLMRGKMGGFGWKLLGWMGSYQNTLVRRGVWKSSLPSWEGMRGQFGGI